MVAKKSWPRKAGQKSWQKIDQKKSCPNKGGLEIARNSRPKKLIKNSWLEKAGQEKLAKKSWSKKGGLKKSWPIKVGKKS